MRVYTHRQMAFVLLVQPHSGVSIHTNSVTLIGAFCCCTTRAHMLQAASRVPTQHWFLAHSQLPGIGHLFSHACCAADTMRVPTVPAVSSAFRCAACVAGAITGSGASTAMCIPVTSEVCQCLTLSRHSRCISEGIPPNTISCALACCRSTDTSVGCSPVHAAASNLQVCTSPWSPPRCSLPQSSKAYARPLLEVSKIGLELTVGTCGFPGTKAACASSSSGASLSSSRGFLDGCRAADLRRLTYGVEASCPAHVMVHDAVTRCQKWNKAIGKSHDTFACGIQPGAVHHSGRGEPGCQVKETREPTVSVMLAMSVLLPQRILRGQMCERLMWRMQSSKNLICRKDCCSATDVCFPVVLAPFSMIARTGGSVQQLSSSVPSPPAALPHGEYQEWNSRNRPPVPGR
jgi:hypothetical protein